MIFLDVDDTLVLYRDDVTPHPYGVLMGLGFRVNHELGVCPRNNVLNDMRH